MHDFAKRLAAHFGTAVEARKGTPGGDSDGIYVATNHEGFVLKIGSARRFDVVRVAVQPRSGTRWIAVSAHAFETAGADDDEAYVQITGEGARVQLAASYGEHAALATLFPISFCRAFLERPHHLVIERSLGAALGTFEDVADVDGAIAVLALLEG